CLWNFGDNGTSQVCDDPSHTYSSTGTFTTTLTLDGPGGNDTMIKTDHITIYEPPVADFDASPGLGAPPLTVEFTNLSTGDFDQCLWDFGDNEVAVTCDNPKHEYKNEGHYTVGLTVVGLGGESTKTVAECVNVTDYRVFLPGVLRKD
ncbi:MAG: PKD domain-containing protein, partial [Candidatus Promineifilaceae bacterium]